VHPNERPVPGETPGGPPERTTDVLLERVGAPVISGDGERIGVIEEIFEDAATGRPEWIGLGAGFLYAHRVLVPLEDAAVVEPGEEALTVRQTKQAVTEAPDADLIDHGMLSPASEARLRAYYGLTPRPDDGRPRLRLRRYQRDDPPDAGTTTTGGEPA
jgi:hypothetical protein